MARGRRAKPDAIKLAQGNPGKRSIRKPELVPVPDAQLEVETRTAFAVQEDFPPPAHLGEEEAAIWRQEAGRIENLNLLRDSDVSAFEVYVSTMRRWRQAKEVLDKQGLSYTTESKHGSMTRQRPEVMIEERCRRTMLNFQREFGMTSISRIKAHSIVAATKMPHQGQLPLQGGSTGAEKSEGQSDKQTESVSHRSPLGALRPQGHA